MVKKLKSGSESAAARPAAGLQGSALGSSVKESAQQIWLAGMGAFSKAQEEGTKVFEALVKEGTSLQKKTQNAAEEKLSEVTGRMSAMADTVSARAGQNWDKLEAIFEARTAKALGKLGVPTAKELQALSARVDALAAAVARLSQSAPSTLTKNAARSSARAAVETPATKAAPPAGAPAKKAPAKNAPAKRTRKADMI